MRLFESSNGVCGLEVTGTIIQAIQFGYKSHLNGVGGNVARSYLRTIIAAIQCGYKSHLKGAGGMSI